jgi:hypothetical protein
MARAPSVFPQVPLDSTTRTWRTRRRDSRFSLIVGAGLATGEGWRVQTEQACACRVVRPVHDLVDLGIDVPRGDYDRHRRRGSLDAGVIPFSYSSRAWDGS